MLPNIDLTNPSIAHHYMVAMHVLDKLPNFGWYDGSFLARFEAARRMLAIIRPERSDQFIEAFDVLQTRPDFSVRSIDDVLPPSRFAKLLEQVRKVPAKALKSYEQAPFGRDILHDLPALTELQHELTPLVAQLAGESVEPSYNFLSLYRSGGRCPPHLDAPSAKWTLDLCLAQNLEWPIHFGKVRPWPTAANVNEERSGTTYTAHLLRPNQAILFSGSAQWHYRDVMPAHGFCHLAFFHYHPKDCGDLVHPERWATYFDLPELAVLDTVFRTMRPDRGE